MWHSKNQETFESVKTEPTLSHFVAFFFSCKKERFELVKTVAVLIHFVTVFFNANEITKRRNFNSVAGNSSTWKLLMVGDNLGTETGTCQFSILLNF